MNRRSFFRSAALILLLLHWPVWAIEYYSPDSGRMLGTFWQISRPGVPPSYLYATIHLEDARIVKMPPLVDQAFHQAKQVIVEVALNEASSQQMAEKMFYQGSTSIRQFLSEQEYVNLQIMLSNYGLDKYQISRIKPWAAAVILSYPKAQTTSLDEQIYVQATKRGQPVAALQTISEQVAVFEQLSVNEQLQYLRDVMFLIAELPRWNAQLKEIYLRGDLDEIQAHPNLYLSVENQQVLDRLYYLLVNTRNRQYVERLLPYLAKGNQFVAISALNAGGRNGIVQQLRRAGYQLQALY